MALHDAKALADALRNYQSVTVKATPPALPPFVQPYEGIFDRPRGRDPLPPFALYGDPLPPLGQYIPPRAPDVTVAASPPPPYMQRYQGLHNEPYMPTVPTSTATVLPPFEPPGGSLPIERYVQSLPQGAPASAPPAIAPSPPILPPMPPPIAIDPQNTALAQALQQAQQQRQLLPEQWRGAFSPQYGEPA